MSWSQTRHKFMKTTRKKFFLLLLGVCFFFCFVLFCFVLFFIVVFCFLFFFGWFVFVFCFFFFWLVFTFIYTWIFVIYFVVLWVLEAKYSKIHQYSSYMSVWFKERTRTQLQKQWTRRHVKNLTIVLKTNK